MVNNIYGMYQQYGHKLLKRAILITTVVAASAVCFNHYSIAQTVDFFPIAKYAGKSKQQVEQGLGKPLSCEKSKYGQKCVYDKEAIEILYIGGDADWITINTGKVPFLASSISALGLNYANPTFKNANTMQWDNVYPGIMSISAHHGEGALVSYFYIKVATP